MIDWPSEIADLRAGRQNLDDLVAKVVHTTFTATHQRPTNLIEAMAAAEDVDYEAPGSWGEVRRYFDNGMLTASEYQALSQAVDARSS